MEIIKRNHEIVKEKRIGFSISVKLDKALRQYCKDTNSSMSSYIKQLIGDDLLEKKYLIKGGKD